MATIKNPTAGIVVYNYKDRSGAGSISSQDVDKIYITKSIVSISTSKNKASPSGRFEVSLAPTKNWVSLISVGSWIEIHMSPRPMSQKDLDSSSIETLKMIGMIDSVRVGVAVDQSTGARSTTYTLVGRDWGAALESCIYIDSAVTNRTDTALQAALRLGFEDLFVSLTKDAFEAKTSTLNLVEKIKNYWGVASAASRNKELLRFAPISEFILPKDLFNKIAKGSKSTLASSINIIAGKLVGKDRYSSADVESVGFIDPSRLIGTNSVWQLMSVHCNDVVNELVADLRWESEKGNPQFALYKRVKPFWLPGQASAEGEGDPRIISSFFNVRKVSISKSSVLALEAGDNAEDVVNFIEIMPQFPSGVLVGEDRGQALLADAKIKSSTKIDPASFARYGVKPLFFSTLFFPPDGSGAGAYYLLTNWLPVLRRWFFDCHKMLNGTITILGQANYIGVGDNILIDSEVFGDLNYTKEQDATKKTAADFKVLAHVQSVSHRFSYVENGARSFITTINFVRGVVTDSKAEKLLGPGSFGISTRSSDVPADKKNSTKTTYLDANRGQ